MAVYNKWAVKQYGTFTVGKDDVGHDVKFFGATSGAYMLWDESTDDLILAGAAGLTVAGAVTLSSTLRVSNTFYANGNVSVGGTITTNGLIANGIFQGGNTTDATNSVSGAWITPGGVGIKRSLYVGVNLGIGNAGTTGSVMTWHAGNFTITHSAGTLTFSGATTFSGAVICSTTLAVTGVATFSDDIVATTSTGADVNVNGIQETLTVSGDCSGSVCGIRVKAVTDGTNRTIGNFYGANVDARLVATGDALSGIMAGLQVAVSLGLCTTGSLWVYGINIDLSEAGGARATAIKAFIDFQDYDSGGSFPCQHLFDVGGSGSRCSTGTSGDIEYHETLHILVNTGNRYIPLSTVEGTYTTAYPIASTYSAGTAFAATVTDTAGGKYGVRVQHTLTSTAAVACRAVSGEVTYTPSTPASGGSVPIGVAGKVILSANCASDLYMWGVQGQLDFANASTLTCSQVAALRGVLTNTGSTSWTSGNIACMYLDNLIDDDMAGINGTSDLMRIANHGGSMDFAINLYGPKVERFVYFSGCENACVTATAATAHGGTIKRIKCKIDATDYYLLASTAPA